MNKQARNEPRAKMIEEAILDQQAAKFGGGAIRSSQTDVNPEDYEWLQYVATLTPNDETGAFLMSDELLDVSLAYDRIPSFSGDVPRKPSGGKTIAGADDDFIKKKMGTAFRRAFEMIDRQQGGEASEDEGTISSTETNTQALRNVILYNLSMGRNPLENIEPSPIAIQLARHYIGWHEQNPISHGPERAIKVLNYVKGTITGKLVVLLPQEKTHQVEFRNEWGWKVEVEFGTEGEEEAKTIYARGLCANVVAGTAYRFRDGLEFDDSMLTFKPLEKA